MKIIIYDCTTGKHILCSSFEDTDTQAEKLKFIIGKDKKVYKAHDLNTINLAGQFVPYVTRWRT